MGRGEEWRGNGGRDVVYERRIYLEQKIKSKLSLKIKKEQTGKEA